jgi:hypothetical protein
MKRIRSIGLVVLATLALAAVAAASASAELPEYMVCHQAARVHKAYVGHYTSALCTEESRVETGGEYELDKGFGKRAMFTAKAGASVLSSAESPEKVVCKTTSISGEFVGSKQLKGVVLKAGGCELSGSKCSSAGATAGHIMTNALKGEFGYLAGKGTRTPTVGLVVSQESAPYAAEFQCETVEVRTQGPIIAEASGNINAISAEATYAFRESGGVQQYTSFEGGGMFEDEWRWEFNFGKGFEPEGGDPSGLELTATSVQSASEIKA